MTALTVPLPAAASDTTETFDILIEAAGTRPPVAAPKLAVIVNCYNYERYVGTTIDSVLSQGRDDVEIIVVDDGSTDGSWQVITASGVKAWKIRNSGQVGACRFGVSRTQAPFVLFLDADDMLKPGSLGKIIARIDPDVAKLQFPLTRINADGDEIGPALPTLADFRERRALAARVLRTGSYASPPTSGNVFRRDLCRLLDEVDYDKAVDGIMLSAAPFLGDVVSLSEEIGCYRVHGDNKSGQGRKPEASQIRRHAGLFSRQMDHLRRILDRIGMAGQLTPTEGMYFFVERSFCADIADGRRPGLGQTRRLLVALGNEKWPLKSKCGMVAFVLLAAVLPIGRAQQLMAYRYRFGKRSVRGFFNAMLSRA